MPEILICSNPKSKCPPHYSGVFRVDGLLLTVMSIFMWGKVPRIQNGITRIPELISWFSSLCSSQSLFFQSGTKKTSSMKAASYNRCYGHVSEDVMSLFWLL